MSHNMTVTVEDTLWKDMKKHSEIRWSAVMKKAVGEKLSVLNVLENLMKKNKLGESEIDKFALDLGRKVNKR